MKNCIIFIFLLFNFNSSAQSSFKIVSAQTKEGLSFATIQNISQKKIYSADKYGEIVLDTQKGDILNITYIGYISKSYSCSEDKTQTIILEQEKKLLTEILVTKCKRIKLYILKTEQLNNDGSRRFGGVACSSNTDTGTAKVAVLLRPTTNFSQLEKIIFWVKRNYMAPKVSIENPLLISFYSVSDTAEMPDQILMDEPIIYYPKKEGKQMIELKKHHLVVPEKGIFICFQWVLDKRYEYDVKYTKDTIDGIAIDTILKYQGALLEGIRTREYKMVFYKYEDDSWFSPKYHTPPIHGTLKLESIFSICED